MERRLEHFFFICSSDTPHAGTSAAFSPWTELEAIYPRYPRIEDIKLSSADYDCWMNLAPYINRSPYTINEHASVPRCYRLFRGLGLRCVGLRFLARRSLCRAPPRATLAVDPASLPSLATNRYLVVANKVNEVVGIITRKDLLFGEDHDGEQHGAPQRSTEMRTFSGR